MSLVAIQPSFPTVRSERLLLSLRTIKYFLTFLLTWQGSQVADSVFQIDTWLPIYGILAADEFFLGLIFIVVLLERTVTQDYTYRRTYFDAPVLVLLIGLFISWSRGVIILQRYALVYEAHEAFILPIALAILANAYRDEEDRWAIFRLLMLAPIFKALDGVSIYIYSSDPRRTWGVIQMWRDGFLLGLGVVNAMLFLHFKPARFALLRKIVLWTFPVLCFSLLMSMRRTFIVGSFVSAMALIVTIGEGRRLRQFGIVISIILFITALIFITDPAAILGRLSGIIAPADEGSAYIRLMEYPNVFQNILHNPIWGTAIGTQWHQYYRMPYSAVYTTLGTHNSYLYYFLRVGLIGAFGFYWLLGRIWKTIGVHFSLARSEEERFISQLMLHSMIVYQVACFFGLMYGDAMMSLFALLLVGFQQQAEHMTGIRNLKSVALIPTIRTRTLTFNDDVATDEGL